MRAGLILALILLVGCGVDGSGTEVAQTSTTAEFPSTTSAPLATVPPTSSTTAPALSDCTQDLEAYLGSLPDMAKAQGDALNAVLAVPGFATSPQSIGFDIEGAKGDVEELRQFQKGGAQGMCAQASDPALTAECVAAIPSVNPLGSLDFQYETARRQADLLRGMSGTEGMADMQLYNGVAQANAGVRSLVATCVLG